MIRMMWLGCSAGGVAAMKLCQSCSISLSLQLSLQSIFIMSEQSVHVSAAVEIHSVTPCTILSYLGRARYTVSSYYGTVRYL